MKKCWSYLVCLLLCSCVKKPDIEMRFKDDIIIRLLACDFIVRQVDDNVYVVKWQCK